jgi:ribose transport system ATP-binding protein
VSAADVPPLLAARRISKSFGGAQALDRVTLETRPGEIHGLLGENGSGKSTLIRILAGYHEPDPGAELELAGRRVAFPLEAGDPRRLGMRFVHQDLGLIPSLSVLENVRLDALSAARGRRLSWLDERRRARASLAELGVELDLDAGVAELSPAQQALLAIARAIDGMDSAPRDRLLVLDEPTAFLPEPEAERLFALVRRLAAAGAGVIFVSHDLAEVRRLADRVTVLRSGRVVATVRTDDVGSEALAELVVGRRLERAGRDGAPAGAVVASIRDLAGEVVHDLSFDLRKGEIVGLTGLLGSGFDEVPSVLIGARSPRSGRISLGAANYDLARMTPVLAYRLGVALLPANRERDGSAGSLSVTDNVTLPALERYMRRHRLDRGRMRRETAELLAELDVRPSDPRLDYAVLSGGNQQKALLARALMARPRLLLLQEPVRGVDVGARRQIFSIVRHVARSGCAVVCTSSDRDELLELCDRALVFSDGVVVATQTPGS